MTTELFDVGVEVLKQDIYLKTFCVTLKYNVVLQLVFFYTMNTVLTFDSFHNYALSYFALIASLLFLKR